MIELSGTIGADSIDEAKKKVTNYLCTHGFHPSQQALKIEAKTCITSGKGTVTVVDYYFKVSILSNYDTDGSVVW